MSHRLSSPLLVVHLLVVGCAGRDERTVGQIEFHDAPCRPPPTVPVADGGMPDTAPETEEAPPPPARFVAAFTAASELTVIDPERGDVLAQASASASAAVRDLDWDGARGRLVVFESDEDEQGGEIAAHTLDLQAPALGPREHLAWVDGVARIIASPLGTVVFEESIGARWRVLWNDGQPRPSVASPRPASAWLQPKAAGVAVHALTYGGGALEQRTAQVGDEGIAIGDAAALDLWAGTTPPTTRMVAAPALDAEVVADVVEGIPALRLSRAALVEEATALEEAGPVGRIEGLAALDNGRTVVLLTSSPTRLLAARLDAVGNVTAEDSLDLPGQARVEEQFFSRDLLVVGPELVLVATDAGVRAVRVIQDENTVALDLAPSFSGLELRGPLAAIH